MTDEGGMRVRAEQEGGAIIRGEGGKWLKY